MKWKKILRNRNLVIGGTLMLILIIMAIFAPLIAPYDHAEYDVARMLKGPSAEHIFGTDGYGRDIFSRVVYGARVSMIICFSVAFFSGLAGTILGLLSGYYKKLERPIMCVMDGMMAIPSMLMAMAIVAALGVGMGNLILALSISNTPRVVRTVRATVISVKQKDYVEAARSMGASDWRILTRYIFSECISPLVVRLTMTMAFLTFLGLGLDPATPSWGIVLSEARTYIRLVPTFTLLPGLVVVLAVYGINALGDGFRDYLDPKLNS